MNEKNVKRAIKVMESVSDKQFDIRRWTNECGTVACFVGWLAKSPEIPEFTMPHDVPNAVPLYKGGYFGSLGLSKFLEISGRDANLLSGTIGSSVHFYGKYLNEVTPADVILKLNEILDNNGNKLNSFCY